MNRFRSLFQGLFTAIVGLLLIFGLITTTKASGNQRTMRSTGNTVPITKFLPENKGGVGFSIGESIRFLFVPERLAFS